MGKEKRKDRGEAKKKTREIERWREERRGEERRCKYARVRVRVAACMYERVEQSLGLTIRMCI